MSHKRPSFLGALVTLIAIGGLAVWWVSALTNEDPLWFLRRFDAEADWITVYWDGRTHMFFPGDPQYDRIMDAFADGVAHWSGYENGVGLSDESLERMRSEGRFLELHYSEPVQVHTRHFYPAARNFYVPLEDTHARWRRVFAGLTDRPRIGVLNVDEERFAALQEQVHESVTP